MPDTGAPWNIPYVAGTDLVRDWPTDSQELAEAVADGLDAAGGLVAVKHALFTGTQTNSTASGANFAVTDLSITHTLADASNKLIITAYLGFAANSQQDARVGLAVADDGTLIGIGTSVGSRTAVGAANQLSTQSGFSSASSGLTFVYEPGDTSSHTYTVRAINPVAVTRTIYINRNQDDTDAVQNARASSGFVIQEVKV